MHLFDVYYRNNAMAVSTCLPAAEAHHDYAINTNWSGYRLICRKQADGTYEWMCPYCNRKRQDCNC